MKYDFLHEDKIEYDGRLLTRIRALRRIKQHNVQVGDLGGYIQNEACLSQEDNEWVPFGFMSFFLLHPIVRPIEE